MAVGIQETGTDQADGDVHILDSGDLDASDNIGDLESLDDFSRRMNGVDVQWGEAIERDSDLIRTYNDFRVHYMVTVSQPEFFELRTLDNLNNMQELGKREIQILNFIDSHRSEGILTAPISVEHRKIIREIFERLNLS